MTADTTPVPDDLLARIAAASDAGKVEELRSLATELPVPTPPPSTLRIIDLAEGTFTNKTDLFKISRTAEFDPGYIDRILQQLDPMTLIERALTHNARGHAEDSGPEAYIRVGNAIERIRAALKGATR